MSRKFLGQILVNLRDKFYKIPVFLITVVQKKCTYNGIHLNFSTLNIRVRIVRKKIVEAPGDRKSIKQP